MKKLLAALAVIGGIILVTSGGRKTTPAPPGPEPAPAPDPAPGPDPVYKGHEDENGDWWVTKDDTIVCGPLPLEENVADAIKRYKSTGHC